MGIHDPTSTATNSIIQIFSVIFTLVAVIGSAVLFSVSFLQKIASPENDAYTRVYGCMMDANFYREAGQCDVAESIKDYQACYRSRHAGDLSCDPYVHGTDMDMLKCIQKDTGATARMTNAFLGCLDLSQSATYYSFQNIGSDVFLGSYNYAVLLTVGLVVMASFVLLTSGGWFHTGFFVQSSGKGGHISGFFSPFSILRILLACVWNIAFLITMIAISFSNTGPASLEDYEKRFPMTLWTCALSIGVFALSSAFYLSYVFEWLGAGSYYLYAGASNSIAPANEDTPADYAEYPTAPPQLLPAATMLYHGTSRHRKSLMSYIPSSGAQTRRSPYAAGWGRGRYVGVKLYEEVADTEVAPKHVMSQMIQAYSWTWVFVDGLIFVGLLTPQAFITNESVVRVFVGIVAARLFQLAGAYKTHKAFLADGNGTVDESRAGVVISAIMDYAASVLCVVAVSLDFMSTYDFSNNASQVISSGASAHSIRVASFVVLLIVPEAVRIITLGMMTYRVYTAPAGGDASNGAFLVVFELLYMYEWMTRFIISAIAMYALVTPARDQNVALSGYFLAT